MVCVLFLGPNSNVLEEYISLSFSIFLPKFAQTDDTSSRRRGGSFIIMEPLARSMVSATQRLGGFETHTFLY